MVEIYRNTDRRKMLEQNFKTMNIWLIYCRKRFVKIDFNLSERVNLLFIRCTPDITSFFIYGINY